MTSDEFKNEIQRLRPILITTAVHYVADEEVAEDVVQEAFLRLWNMRKTLYVPLDSLAKVIVRNLSISYLRHQKPYSPIANIDARDTAEAEKEDERIERVLSIVDALPEKQRLLLRLRHMEGMQMQEIARLTNNSEIAVRQTLSRARKAVRDQYLKKGKRLIMK